MKKKKNQKRFKAQHSENKDHGIWSNHFMPNRWEINGNSGRLYFWGGSKNTADGDCSHEFKTLTPWKKSYDQTRQHIKKQRHVFLVKAMLFPVVMNGCEIWTIKNVAHRGVMLLNCGVGEDS